MLGFTNIISNKIKLASFFDASYFHSTGQITPQAILLPEFPDGWVR
jgi:hypothetical protein